VGIARALTHPGLATGGRSASSRYVVASTSGHAVKHDGPVDHSIQKSDWDRNSAMAPSGQREPLIAMSHARADGRCIWQHCTGEVARKPTFQFFETGITVVLTVIPAVSKGLSTPHAPLDLRLAFGASSFSLSNASGIIRPNIELNIAVGIKPALLFS
jgi:hypothetical protein